MKKSLLKLLMALMPGLCLLPAMQVHAQGRAQSDLYSVLQGACSNYLDVTANDSTGGLQITQIQVGASARGGITGVNGQYVTYCPPNSFVGSDNFTYTITFNGGITSTATVYINVAPYNEQIFPGDADQNGTVEHFDILNIGLSYGLTGPARDSNVSVNALAWSPSIYVSHDPAAADCDGNGLVDASDTFVVASLYHQTNPAATAYVVDTSQCSAIGLPFYLQAASDSVNDGDTLDVAIKLGSDFGNATAYGIAFTLEYDTGFIGAQQIIFDAGSSWVLQNNNGIFFNRSARANGEIEVALTRTDHNPSSGGGTALLARFPIEDNIDGIIQPAGWYNLHLKLKAVRLINQYDVLQDVCVQEQSFTVHKLLAGIRDINVASVSIYPNPANALVYVSGEQIQSIILTDITGRKVFAENTGNTGRVVLDIKKQGIEAGSYLLQVKTASGTITKKLIVQQ